MPLWQRKIERRLARDMPRGARREIDGRADVKEAIPH